MVNANSGILNEAFMHRVHLRREAHAVRACTQIWTRLYAQVSLTRECNYQCPLYYYFFNTFRIKLIAKYLPTMHC
uniref:Uncharacterized protein n=1 Tax=Pararge aegeria TaxID=116150 RepID=S4P4A0_9NEOP